MKVLKSYQTVKNSMQFRLEIWVGWNHGIVYNKIKVLEQSCDIQHAEFGVWCPYLNEKLTSNST